MKIKGTRVQSAGIFKGSTLDPVQQNVCSKCGIDIRGKPRSISTRLLQWQNMIVLVADDVPPSLFKEQKKYGKDMKVWMIPDTRTNSHAEIRNVIVMIIKQVNRLAKELAYE